MKPLIIIPARLKATRLPDKPLAMIGGKPMIVHVLDRARESGIGPVLVATDSAQVMQAVEMAGGMSVMTDPKHPSGSDRIWEALQKFDAKGIYDIIINLQGDVPTLEPHLLNELLTPLKDPKVDISTLAAEITDPAEHTSPSVVKAVLAEQSAPGHARRALYFSRATVPANDGPRYHHIGVYGYRRDALQRFVSLPPSPLEQREKLEQLRALEAGMRIAAMVVSTIPLGVDTPEDLEKARKSLGAK